MTLVFVKQSDIFGTGMHIWHWYAWYAYVFFIKFIYNYYNTSHGNNNI